MCGNFSLPCNKAKRCPIDASSLDVTMAKEKMGQMFYSVLALLSAWTTKNSWLFERSAKNLPNATLLGILTLFV